MDCMNYICKTITILSALVMMSCSTGDFLDKEITYEYEPEWAAAYFLGSEGELSNYKLVLTAGRTDEEENLISGGAILTLMLNAPTRDVIDLPDGRYQASATKGMAYTFDYGLELDGSAIEGSFVTTRLPGTKNIYSYPLDKGDVYVVVEEDGDYRVKAEVGTESYDFEFLFDGRLMTFNLTSPF